MIFAIILHAHRIADYKSAPDEIQILHNKKGKHGVLASYMLDLPVVVRFTS